MEQFIAEIEAYAAACSKTPQKVLRDAIGANWGQWDSWKSGDGSPTMKVVDRLRDYMLAHPAPASTGDAA
ncbi:hypothetical protein BYZ73_20410 [Rhodovulum viride]|uniref:Antitoxin Xre/MbcA/ParS-like toxin-binding domain-containing protein n=1 Tax=Rhodovulum viride TaxID=1231134 RepID=A0ABX9DBI2_9RHOB|nr:hypothetical protein [Rhodovulum viride]RAP39463.1 hypothetical protein BYZ73_20410 [Rhodovulum viride]